MTALRRRWLLLVAGGAVAACTGLVTTLGGAGGDTIKFPHERHQRAQVDCAACHDSVYESQDVREPAEGGSFFPAEQKCLECHREQKEKSNCSFCHTNPAAAGPWPRKERLLKLSHEGHLRYVEEDCARCHVSLSAPGVEAVAPPMSACNGCHQKDFDAGRCGMCHVGLSRFALKPITSFSHQAGFVRQHAVTARASAESCAECHDQTYCAQCHASTTAATAELKFPERADREFIHRGDFVGRHTLEARADSAACKRCHGTAYCESCHTLQNRTARSADPRNPHPAGWSFPGAGGSLHGQAARRDIGSCAACHDQGAKSICVECHEVGGVGGNPHPATWLSKHGRPEITNNGMCLACHL